MIAKLLAAVLVTAAIGVTKIAQAQVAFADLERRDGLYYEKGSETPFSGPVQSETGPTGQLENGNRVGEWLWSYPDGSQQFWLVYNNEGVRERSKRWHQNGRVDSEATYKNGRADGKMQHWYEDGTLRLEHSFVEGKQNGTETIWDQDGTLLYSAEFDDGERHGAVIWWYRNSNKRWETHFDHGVRTGTWIQSAEDGSLQMETKWEGGALVSRHDPHAGH